MNERELVDLVTGVVSLHADGCVTDRCLECESVFVEVREVVDLIRRNGWGMVEDRIGRARTRAIRRQLNRTAVAA